MTENPVLTTSRGTPSYSWIALGLLFVVALFNYLDRYVFSIMQVDVQRDLHLSDTQLGTLTGLSFALFYTTFAIPVARLADKVNRRYVLTASMVLWTAMTALGSVAKGYGSLLACRVGVAIGEAGCVPASHSMLSDFFPRHRRALVMGIWCLALPFGAMLGFGVGGQLTALKGWRESLAIIGLAGLGSAPIIFFFLREPTRGIYDPPAERSSRSFGEAAGLLWRTRSYRYLVLGEATQGIAQNGAAAWNAPFYTRAHHIPLGELALYLAVISGLGGAFGAFLGGATADKLARRDSRWYMLIPAIAAAVAVPLALTQYLAGNAGISLCVAFGMAVSLNVFLGPCNAVSQSLMPPDVRALTAAVFLTTTALVGLGIGPTLIGFLSDHFSAGVGTRGNALRYALIIVTIPALLASMAMFLLSSRHLKAELAPMHAPLRVEGDIFGSEASAAG